MVSFAKSLFRATCRLLRETKHATLYRQQLQDNKIRIVKDKGKGKDKKMRHSIQNANRMKSELENLWAC